MKTNESLLHKGMRTIVQSALRREANEPLPCVLGLPAASSRKAPAAAAG